MDSFTPIVWQAYEYHHVPKSTDWFWAVSIIAICIAIVAIIYGDFLFAIVIIFGTLALFIYAVRRPELVRVELNGKGIVINTKFYPYVTLESFWVEEFNNVHPHPKLLIKSQKFIMPLLAVPIDEIHHEEVRQFLLDFLPEEELAEPLSQKLMEHLGF